MKLYLLHTYIPKSSVSFTSYLSLHRFQIVTFIPFLNHMRGVPQSISILLTTNFINGQLGNIAESDSYICLNSAQRVSGLDILFTRYGPHSFAESPKELQWQSWIKQSIQQQGHKSYADPYGN